MGRDISEISYGISIFGSPRPALTAFAKVWGIIAEGFPESQPLIDAPLDLLYLLIFKIRKMRFSYLVRK